MRKPVLKGKSLKRRSDTGSILIAIVLVLLLMASLTTALFVVAFQNKKQSVFYGDRSALRQYAEGGVYIAMVELNSKVNGSDGNVGTENWTTASDLGRDGKASTHDEGEGDGLPTPGEPNLASVSIGPTGQGIRFLARTTDASWGASSKRIVSVTSKGNSLVTVEAYVKPKTSGGGLGGVYMASVPGSFGSSNTSNFDGYDYTGTGTKTSNPPLPGLVLPTGSPAGSNISKFMPMLKLDAAARIYGIGGTPSVREATAPDFNAIYDSFKAKATQVWPAGTYSNTTVGSWPNDLRIVHITGNGSFSGTGGGAGVLLVDGNLALSSTTKWTGLVLVKGTQMTTSGGGGWEVLGGLMMGNTAITKFAMSGTSSFKYSSEVIAKLGGLGGGEYGVQYMSALK